MPRARYNRFVQEVLPQGGLYALCAFSALTDKPGPAIGKPLDCRYPDLFLEAPGNYLAFIQAQIEGPAHDPAFRLAAARASARFE